MLSFMIVGHRGAAGLAPENTLPSFIEASKYDIDFIELDVRETKDGALVVVHDDNLERTANYRGLVSHMTLREIKELDAGGWFSEEFAGTEIPTLEEAIEVLRDKPQHIIVEIKKYGIERKVIDALKGLDIVDRILIASFNLRSLFNVRKLDSGIPLVFITNTFTDNILRAAVKLGARILALRKDAVTKLVVERCHRNGVLINAWIVNDVSEAIRYLLMGVDIISTDYPNIMSKLRTKIMTKLEEALENILR